jgi:hypothetical protein
LVPRFCRFSAEMTNTIFNLVLARLDCTTRLNWLDWRSTSGSVLKWNAILIIGFNLDIASFNVYPIYVHANTYDVYIPLICNLLNFIPEIVSEEYILFHEKNLMKFIDSPLHTLTLPFGLFLLAYITTYSIYSVN